MKAYPILKALVLAAVSVALCGCAGKDDRSASNSEVEPAKVAAGASPSASAPGSPEVQSRQVAGHTIAGSASQADSLPADPAPNADSGMKSFTAMADSQPDRYLIKNATLTVEAADVRQATATLVQAVQAAKGYVSDMHEQADGVGGLTATMQVRVPFTVFDKSIQQLSDLGKVLERQITAQDVTEEFVDTAAKVRNLKRTELRLLDHLNKTGRLPDTLLVEKELNRVREEIEQLEGRVRFLSHRIAFSTITMTLKEKAKVQALVPAQSYSAAKEGSDAVRSLVEFGRSVLSMAIWVVVWIPVWGPLAVLALLLIRAMLRRYRAVHVFGHSQATVPGPAR